MTEREYVELSMPDDFFNGALDQMVKGVQSVITECPMETIPTGLFIYHFMPIDAPDPLHPERTIDVAVHEMGALNREELCRMLYQRGEEVARAQWNSKRGMPLAVFLLQEAWQIKGELGESPQGNFADIPGRYEVVTISGATIDGRTNHASLTIVREGGGEEGTILELPPHITVYWGGTDKVVNTTLKNFYRGHTAVSVTQMGEIVKRAQELGL